MIQTDFERFRSVMTGMAKMYERELDAPLLDAYWLALRDWSLADFEKGAAHLMSSSEFMPRPSQFNALRRAGKPTAAEAWDRVLQHCKGAYRDGAGIDNGGPIDLAVAGIGGYKSLAMRNLDYLPIAQRDFAESYADQAGVAEVRAAVPQIADHHTRTQIRHEGLQRVQPPTIPRETSK